MGNSRKMRQQLLAGKRVLVTRRPEQAGPLREALEAVGAEVVLFPLLEIGPPDDWSALDECLAKLDTFRWLVFTSPNAVDFFFARLADRGSGSSFPKQISIAAIGRTTADRLRGLGIAPDLMPSEATQEGLVKAFRAIPVEGQEILIPGSAIGRTYLAEALAARGARVHSVAAYANRPPNPAQVKLPAALVEGRIDLAIFASPSAIENFFAVLGEARARAFLETTAIACIGPTTAAAIEALGVQVDIQPEDEISVPALVRAICTYCAART